MTKNKHVLIYDGDCPLCNGLVRFVYRSDKDKILLFASSNSNYAKLNQMVKGIDLKSTVVYISSGNCYVKSRAVYNLFSDLKMPKILLWVFYLFSYKFMDKIYDIIANNRYRICRKKPMACYYEDDFNARLLD